MKVRTESKKSFKVVGMTLSVLLREERKKHQISSLHDDFDKRAHEISHQVAPSIGYGIFIDPPKYNPETDPFTWIAGVEVSEITNVPANMDSFEFPENMYAITTYQRPKGEAGDLYSALYQWVSQSEYCIVLQVIMDWKCILMILITWILMTSRWDFGFQLRKINKRKMVSSNFLRLKPFLL